MSKPTYQIVSFSGGKDSTAMLLHLLELGEQIDEVIFCDTYMEFPALIRQVEKIKKLVEEKGIKFTILKNEHSFEYFLLEYQPKRKNPDLFIEKYGKLASGKGWATSRVRWCTGELKSNLADKYVRELKQQYNLIECIGIAADEIKRINNKNNTQGFIRLPLVEWGWTEAQCLQYCYDKGYDWEGLYNIFNRVSCWCCPLQSLAQLRKLRKHFPDLWLLLLELDSKTFNSFRYDSSVFELEQRFEFEEERLAEGKSITNREFFNELKERLGRE